MDITTDGFGFMLAFGDLAWVPFIYSLQVQQHTIYLHLFTIYSFRLMGSRLGALYLLPAGALFGRS